ELKEFRADLGTEMAQVLRAIANQLSNITNHWREDLALLMRQAVSSGTGWVLDNNHETILKSLVFQAVNLLEEREVVTLRVNPEDEAIVSDLFRAAREKAPELKQWIVNGDDSIERGGLVAESGSGSVDLKRQNYRNLVADILEHLSLPVLDEEKRAEQKIKQQAEVAARRFEGVLPPKEVEPKVDKEEEPLNQVVPKVQEEPEPKIEPELNTEPKPEPELKPLEDERKPTPTKSETETEKEKPILKVEKKLPPEMPEDMGMELPEDVFETESEPAAEAPEARDDNSLQALEEELFPVGQDEESQVLANGGFLPERES
ncbi:MAG: flagellar assembly protein FliH, partial [Desulfovibrionaceae bacterium]|nr:flagellar assembly protein FliH [Desulfovibrionaceae bacterium]